MIRPANPKDIWEAGAGEEDQVRWFVERMVLAGHLTVAMFEDTLIRAIACRHGVEGRVRCTSCNPDGVLIHGKYCDACDGEGYVAYEYERAFPVRPVR